MNELDVLRSAFLKVSGMRERTTRDLYIDELNNQLGNALSFPRHHDPLHDVWALLRACQDHRNGIRALATILRSFYRDSRPMIELDELIECLFPDELLEPDEREQLAELLTDTEPQQLQMASRHAGSPTWLTTAVDWSDPVGVARRLEASIGRFGAPHPLLVFIDFLAHQLDAVRSAEQHRWIDKVGIRNNVSLNALRDLCVSATARLDEAQRFYFIVQLEPDGIDPDGHFLMSVWLQQHHSVEEPLHCDDTPLTLSEVADRLPDLLGQALEAFGAGSGDLVLEFIVPRSLISHPIDQWEIDRVFPHRLGTSYPVVVRCVERLRNPELQISWRNKWRQLVKNGHRGEPSTIYWLLDQGALAPSSLRATLITEPSLVALAMAFPPENSVDLKQDELTAALYAGVPVILWCRDPGVVGSRFESDIRDLVAGRGLTELPTQVLQLRQNADKDSDTGTSLGWHLTLVWDDADRVPQAFVRKPKLRAPQ